MVPHFYVVAGDETLSSIQFCPVPVEVILHVEYLEMWGKKLSCTKEKSK